MNRRFFLRSAAVASTGLIVGDAALEAWDRLTWRRRLWPGAEVKPTSGDMNHLDDAFRYAAGVFMPGDRVALIGGSGRILARGVARGSASTLYFAWEGVLS